jgi:hypothetical protein
MKKKELINNVVKCNLRYLQIVGNNAEKTASVVPTAQAAVALHSRPWLKKQTAGDHAPGSSYPGSISADSFSPYSAAVHHSLAPASIWPDIIFPLAFNLQRAFHTGFHRTEFYLLAFYLHGLEQVPFYL